MSALNKGESQLTLDEAEGARRTHLTEIVPSRRPCFAGVCDEDGVIPSTSGVEDELRLEFLRVILIGEVGEEEGERCGGSGGGGRGVGGREGEG